ncbi:MAG: GIY-YIG nuclease family protein [Patescibacteria group bacterium]|jgi:putative endonuclease
MFIKNHNYYVYILASKRNGTLYVGVTSRLFNRISQHKIKFYKNSFTAKYNVNKLVYYERYQYIKDAISREKELKKWGREWKIKLIEKENSTWRDIYNDIL